MWRRTGQFILSNRFVLILIIALTTGFMAYQATKVELSYEFSRVIPKDHPKQIAYQEFRKNFGEDGNLLVIGLISDSIFSEKIYNDYARLSNALRKAEGVEDIIGMPAAINLVKDSVTESLSPVRVFENKHLTQQEIDSSREIFLSLPFYRHLLYNPETNAWLLGLRINREVLASKKRERVVDSIIRLSSEFGQTHNLEIHLSGLPLIRTVMAKRIADEMRWFLLASLLLSAAILMLFFRSGGAVVLSLGVVIIGVIWSLGFMALIGYKISLLTALIPPLIVVIGIPNCIYFLNKFHTAYNETKDKMLSLVIMVERMGIVTLFCNIAAAIGFAVFALTRSAILKEFGLVAGVSIMVLFFISLVLIPAILSYRPAPRARHMKYLESPRLNRWLARLERWSLNHRKLIYTVSIVIVILSVLGMFRLRSEGFIVDDLPKTDKIYTDLKFFEKHFKGVMPLEIVVDTRQTSGLRRNFQQTVSNMDSLSQYIFNHPDMGRPLSIVEGMKFAKQAFFEGDSSSYTVPTEFDLPFLSQYLSTRKDTSSGNNFTRLLSSFMDSSRQQARLSVNMADVGSYRLPHLLDSIQKRGSELFDSSKYDVKYTGSSVTFVEGSRFIINGLKESIIWAFVLIALCMLYLFRSWRILACSLIPNVIPLVMTAGLMGWAGVRLKPSTVLIFSVALGIAIDITIRFLVNYKQELPRSGYDKQKTVIETIHSTGISIIYTSLVLIAGFIIFFFSGFGGTQSLGWLTSFTLITATVTNLVLLPALLISLGGNGKKQQTLVS